MTRESHKLTLPKKIKSKLVLAALDAANMSYAPYTKSFNGIAIETINGKIFSAAYAENAAFNPSMSPLEGILVILRLGGETYLNISKVILIEVKHPKISQFAITKAVLNSVCPQAKLEVLYALE